MYHGILVRFVKELFVKVWKEVLVAYFEAESRNSSTEWLATEQKY